MRTLSYLFGAAGLLGLAWWAVMFANSRVYQAREIQRFVSNPPAVRLSPGTGSPVAMLEIPRLGLWMIVIEGAGERELKSGPGHIGGTSLPGGGGNIGVAGHRDTFFRPLRLIRKDDTITLVTHERAYRYKVVSTQVVGPEDVEVLYPTEHETLTLVTCYPFNFIGPAPKRFIVRADCEDCVNPQL